MATTTPEKIDKLLAKTLDEITKAHSGELELVETDVRYCGLMEKYYLLHFQKRTLEGEHDKAGRASEQAQEWSKRKASALKARKDDLLPKIMQELERRDMLGRRLAELK